MSAQVSEVRYDTRLEMMRDLVKPGFNICEIGVFTGDFSNQLLELNPGRLVLIDPWVGTVPCADPDGQNLVSEFLPRVYVNLAQHFSQHAQVTVLRGYSHELLPLFPQNYFDLMYIDGDHSYEGVARDLEICWSLTKDGGYICGHDYETNPAKSSEVWDFGVKQAVDEFCSRRGLRLLGRGWDGQVSFAIRKEQPSWA